MLTPGKLADLVAFAQDRSPSPSTPSRTFPSS